MADDISFTPGGSGTLRARELSGKLVQVVFAGACDTDGWTLTKTISAASTNATSLKASAGTVHAIFAWNKNAAVRYLKLYNKASAPTVGTDTPVLTIPLKADVDGTGANDPTWIVLDAAFGTGIAWALTTGDTDADTGAVGAGDIFVHILHK